MLLQHAFLGGGCCDKSVCMLNTWVAKSMYICVQTQGMHLPMKQNECILYVALCVGMKTSMQ